MAGRKRTMGATRFVGGLVPLDLFEAFEAARGDRGIGDRSAALRSAIALWVESNPPNTGLGKAIADTLTEIRRSQAVRGVTDSAIIEWRLSQSPDLLNQIALIHQLTDGDLAIPGDVSEAIENRKKR